MGPGFVKNLGFFAACCVQIGNAAIYMNMLSGPAKSDEPSDAAPPPAPKADSIQSFSLELGTDFWKKW